MMNVFNSRRVLTACAFACVSLCSLNAQAQQNPNVFLPGNVVPAGVVQQASMGLAGGAGGQQPLSLGADEPIMNLQPKNAKSFDNADIGQENKPTAATKPAVQPLTQFQRFVLESTGQRLPIYGSNLFASSKGFAPVTNVAAPNNYQLGVGDEIQLQIWGGVEWSGVLKVERDGRVNVPKVGPITLAGVSAAQLDAVLRNHLKKMFVNFELSATISKLRSIQVFVVGHAQQPGTYTISSLSTLINALIASGGPSPTGSMRSIQLKRGNQVLTTVDLYDFISKGQQAKDISLQSGDVIVIPPAGPRIALAGAVDQQAIFELKSGRDQLSDVLALGGGVPVLAASQKAMIERIDAQATPPRRVQEVALDTQGVAITLKDGDVVTLLGISPAFANAVTLKGHVAQPLRYSFKPGMRVLDLIPDRDALIRSDYFQRKNDLAVVNYLKRDAETDVTQKEVDKGVARLSTKGRDDVRSAIDQIRYSFEAINWEYAVIERLDKATLTNQLIPFNLGQAVIHRNPDHNIELQPGDVISIFSQKDIKVSSERQSRFVRLEGEVAAPGVYVAQPGETISQLIERTGGLTQRAYLFGTEFKRVSVREMQQQNLDKLIGKIQDNLQSDAANATFNNIGQDGNSVKAKIESQKAVQEAQVTRLRKVASSGRVALELTPDVRAAHELPLIALEDGDEVYIPSKPSFVGAFGAVQNENVLLYKAGRTVKDVLDLVGPTPDAELAEVFLVRADGTTVTDYANRGFWGTFKPSAVMGLVLMPGDTVVVPAKLDRENAASFWTRYLKDWTQIFSNFGLGMAALRSL